MESRLKLALLQARQSREPTCFAVWWATVRKDCSHLQMRVLDGYDIRHGLCLSLWWVTVSLTHVLHRCVNGGAKCHHQPHEQYSTPQAAENWAQSWSHFSWAHPEDLCLWQKWKKRTFQEEKEWHLIWSFSSVGKVTSESLAIGTHLIRGDLCH